MKSCLTRTHSVMQWNTYASLKNKVKETTNEMHDNCMWICLHSSVASSWEEVILNHYYRWLGNAALNIIIMKRVVVVIQIGMQV